MPNLAQNGSHGFFVTHPEGLTECRVCGKLVASLAEYREHVTDTHLELLEYCGCCGADHLADFDGDCREDWERF